MARISEGQAAEARRVLKAYETQDRQALHDADKTERDRLEKKLVALSMTPALETYLQVISEKEHDELNVTSVPPEEHIRRIKKRNLEMLMQAVNQIAYIYNVQPDAFLDMMAKLPTKDAISFEYRSWYKVLKEKYGLT